jgi:tetratricopeptide (TPR) repeat protein
MHLNCPPALLLLGLFGLASGELDPSRIEDLYAHSVAVAEETRRNVPGSSKPVFDLGRVHQRFGHDDEAVKVYREALQIDPHHPEILSQVGFVLSQQNRMDEALAAYREALRLAPGIEDAHARIGLILVHQGRHAEAVEEFSAEIQNRTASPLTYTVLGHALRDLKRNREAIASYREALRLNPEERGAYYGLSQLYQQLGQSGEEASARAEFMKLKEKEAQSNREALTRGENRAEQLRKTALTYLEAAVSYAQAGKTGEAERRARAALKFDPAHEGALRLLFDLLHRGGRGDECVSLCREALARKRTTLVLYQLAGHCLEKDSPVEAAGLLEEAVRLDPEMSDAHRELAKIILRGNATGGPQRALELARRAVELSPREAMNHDVQSWALFTAGDLPAALESLQIAIRLDPGNEATRRRLAEMQRRLPPGGAR